MNKPGWRASAIWSTYAGMGLDFSEQEFAIFIDLKTRVEMVEKLTEIKFSGYTADTSHAYQALLKVALAWSALDRVMVLTGRKDDFNITNSPLSAAIKAGKFDKMIDSLKGLKGADVNNKGLLNDIGRGRASSKLNRLAKAIRNSMFHGSLNPTRVGLSNAPRKQALLIDLSDAILDACLSEFERWSKARR